MTQAQKLEALIEGAIVGGWRGGRHLNWSGDWIGEVPTLEVMSLFPSHPFLRYTTGGVDVEEHTYPPEIMLFDKDFARALFGEDLIETGLIEDWYRESEMSDIEITQQELPAFQYRLQQAVISDNPIDYYYDQVFGK